MRIKLERKTFDDGRVREVVMFRPHWWSSWRPILNDKGDFVVNWGHLSENDERIISKMRLLSRIIGKERSEARLSMMDMILDCQSVYVSGYSLGEGYYVAYDTPSERVTVEDLQNLEIKEE